VSLLEAVATLALDPTVHTLAAAKARVAWAKDYRVWVDPTTGATRLSRSDIEDDQILAKGNYLLHRGSKELWTLRELAARFPFPYLSVRASADIVGLYFVEMALERACALACEPTTAARMYRRAIVAAGANLSKLQHTGFHISEDPRDGH
jgi:hypothetical protein